MIPNTTSSNHVRVRVSWTFSPTLKFVLFSMADSLLLAIVLKNRIGRDVKRLNFGR